MNSSRRYIAMLSAFTVTLLTGCATRPVSTDEAREVARSSVLDVSLLEPRPGYGQVIVKRDRGLSASACKSRVFANGTPAADIAPGERVTLYLPPGDQMLAARAVGICIGGLVETRATVSASKPAIFRISYGSSGEFSIQPTAF